MLASAYRQALTLTLLKKGENATKSYNHTKKIAGLQELVKQ
jgi:hypothetical protein